MTDILDELQWRGLIAQHTDIDALRAALNEGSVTFYCGFDPTAPSLHHGHLVAVKVMRHLQMAGHHPLALVGGATGLIGDPRAKGERSLNTKDVVAGWARSLQAQLENLLDFEGDNPARIVNNLDWTGQMTAVDFLRDLGKHFRMGTMLSKDIVARRLASEEGISFTEFSYQILQANDYLELFRRYGCTLEVGGNDQWGNLVGGMDLIHKVEGESVHVMTNPLITKADGTKFGKTEGGAIWLNPQMLSPYAFYQFWLRVDDVDVVRFLKVFTFLDREEIERLERATQDNPKAREAQKVLAREVTTWVHGAAAVESAEAATQALWGRGELSDLDEATVLQATADLPTAQLEVGRSTIVDLLVAAGLEKGRSAARKTVAGGGAYLNNVKVEDEDRVVTKDDLLAGGVVLVRKGRRNLAVARQETPQA
ncbi:tyrosine--tRNA ligase [Actinomyces urogenitalis DSM 15434]|uniref:Tyrosine--tRNA ligase n=1 Tax=Actinomyces urogenitalis DSM 15434 TaxID=525246 RepID=C0W7M8_9ACTO|nr:tyrosine--tRNA ligase [Actinomyces urogenitalis]EEH65279.1 tyrosine--tRNA ligase [Actinomyces urogenitalis DSM 15434]MBS6073033.1 tyrosine--tRNA ligase [Actinomyces urogenitalis]MDK8237024.1 tyrosine--tRNA ligase [Actinomyces urogenitalis]MDK8834260.1 tyrosine--tRNA ligase [Actinomyces urogenitalis]MDU0864917.1 tyrosine--tRNA ligase [Actinomyces urogenitalis]